MLTGTLSKMRIQRDDSGMAEYFMRLGSEEVPMQPYLGQKLRLEFSGEIHCAECGVKTPKSYSQGYCFKHARSLAACDLCIVRPETCHHHLGTCRQPDWGTEHCMIPHTVYLSNSSGVKVGITRSKQVMTRWLDQGAVQAIPLVQVQKRLDAGLVESVLKKHVMDKTNWRTMLKGEVSLIDMQERAEEILSFLPDHVETTLLSSREEVRMTYPVLEYPSKITSLNFDKNPLVEGTLLGLKGQYLILDVGVINMRKFSSYQVTLNEASANARPIGAVQKPEEMALPITRPTRRPELDIPRDGPFGSW
jgi:hypothetical protein